ncbi:MAG: SGNH/GDSL hydrolase family protein [Hyphomicrobiaceae bacterium]
MRRAVLLVALLATLATQGALTGAAQPQPEPQGQLLLPSNPPDISPQCVVAGATSPAVTPLPNTAKALKSRNVIRILAIGASPNSMLGTRSGAGSPLLEQILERAIKGLDVEIINRGVSGELAEAAAARLKVEVAMEHPDLVLWQVGTNDAFARVPLEDFQATVTDMVQWLKQHNVDVILIGLHYLKQLAKDPYYQSIRMGLRRIATNESVLRVNRYEAMEILSQVQNGNRPPDPDEFGNPERGYDCLAQYLARAISVGLYAKPAKANPSEPPKKAP